MKKTILLTSTALIISVATLVSPAKAETSWMDSLTTSVESWWSNDTQTTQVEAYLDEVTIAVPPMTGEDAAAIQPAAGDYIEEIQEELNDMPSVAPGSMLNDEQSFNTEFSNVPEAVAAFEDNSMSADDFANIMPASGDAEEIVDEAIVVVEEHTEEGIMDHATDMVKEHVPEMMEHSPVVEEMATDMVEDHVEAVVENHTPDIADTAVDAVKDHATDAMDGHDMMDTAVEAVEEHATEKAKEHAPDAVKGMMSH